MSALGRARQLAPALIAVACGLLLWAVARGHEGYDLDYALIWGDQLAHGHVPTLSGRYAPTPHPLANALGALLSPLGRPASADMFIVLVELSLGVVAVATWSLARAMLGRWVGLLAAVVVVTRPVLVGSALRGSIDIPALALTLSALAVLLRPRPRWTLALVLLAVAGLLRPEAWLLSLGVGVWRWVEAGRPRRLLAPTAALALAAPVAWALTDLLLTGDPAFSLTGTRVLAEELGRPRTAVVAPLLVPSFLATVIGVPVLLAGTIGLAVYAGRPPRHFHAVLGVFALSLLSFIVIGAAGLPLLARYMFPPAVLLIVLGSGAALRAAPMQRTRGDTLVAVAASIALLAAVPATVQGLQRAVDDSLSRRAIQGDLRTLVAQPAFRRALDGCPPLAVGIYRLAPIVAYAAGLPPASIATEGEAGTLLLPRSGRAADSLTSASDPTPPLLRPPIGFALDDRARSRDWAVAVSCPATP